MFDPTTAAAYAAAATAAARAQAVRDSLGSGTLTVEIHDGATLKFSGTCTGPMTAGADGSLSHDAVLSGAVASGGTPDAATWTCRITNGSRYIEGSFGPGGRFTSPKGDLIAGQSMRLNVSVAAPASGWLPAQGFAKRVSALDAWTAAKPANQTIGNFAYSLWGSFGSGNFNPHYSARGAWILPGSGGHSHPSMFGAAVFDLDTMAWSYLPCANAGIVDSNGAILIDASNGAPWYEMLSSAEVPLPTHPYKNLMVRSPTQGGGPLGSMIYVGRGSVTSSGTLASGAAHAFDLSTRLWSRLSTADTFGYASVEHAVVFDPAAGRYYQIPPTVGVSSSLKYLDAADWTFKNTASYPGYATNLNAGTNSAWIHELDGVRALFSLRSNDATGVHYLSSINLDSPQSGWNNNIALNGASLANERADVCYHPVQNVYYRRGRAAQGQVLYRLTPPTSNILTGAWTVDTVALTGDTIADYYPSESGHSTITSVYRNLVYAPALQMLAWVTPNGVFLLNP